MSFAISILESLHHTVFTFRSFICRIICFLQYVLFWDKNGTHLDDVIKRYKNRNKIKFWGKSKYVFYYFRPTSDNAKLLHCDDSECISSKFILEKYIQLHTKYTWF